MFELSVVMVAVVSLEQVVLLWTEVVFELSVVAVEKMLVVFEVG